MKNAAIYAGQDICALVRFVLPVLMALFLKTMYGAGGLMVEGQSGTGADVSAISTGSLVMYSVILLVHSIAMGLIVLLG